MHRPHVILGAPPALLVLACLCGCGGRQEPSAARTPTPRPSSSAAPAQQPATPTLLTTASAGSRPPAGYAVQVSLSGADPLQGPFIQAASGGCGVPASLSGSVGGRRFTLVLNNRAAPPGQAQQLSPGDITLQVGADLWNVGSSSNAPQGTTGTLVHRTDGSGSVTFANLYLSADPTRTPQESGTVSWTCR